MVAVTKGEAEAGVMMAWRFYVKAPGEPRACPMRVARRVFLESCTNCAMHTVFCFKNRA